MKKRLAIAVIGVALLLGLSGSVKAEEFGYVRYELDCGTVCYDFGEWGYCQEGCDEAVCEVPEATKTPAPTNTDAPEATATDVPEVTPVVTPEATKQPCNQGLPHEEECDPGNSNHNQPSNDEGGRKPGTAGPRGK